MRDDTLIFEAAEEKNRLKLGVYKPDDVIWRYDDLLVPMERVKSRCNEIKETLNKASRNGGGAHAYDKLMAVGRMLCDELLSNNIKEKLSKTDAEYLILKLDDNLVQIPWELLCVDAAFLCQRFSVGRVVKTRQEVVKNNDRSMTRPLKMWIVANPRGDLRVAEAEGLGIFRDMAKMNVEDPIVEPTLDMEITPDEIRENLKSYDFVHFAGHADYNCLEPVTSGWRLTDGNFTVSDIDKMAGGSPMPALIFSNACQSARTEGWDSSDGPTGGSFEMTNAFLRSGVKHYVGTSWEIMDEPSSYFSREFYDHLRSGKTVGESVKHARINLTEKYGPDICWSSYLLYGDPTVRYFRHVETVAPEKTETPKPMPQHNVLTRGSIFKDAVNATKLKDIHGCAVALSVCVALVIAISLAIFASDRISIREKGIDSEKRVEIERMLIERADSQQDRTEALFEKLNTLVADLPVKNTETDDHPSIVTVFDSMMSRKGNERILLYAIQDGIIHSLKNFRLLEYESFDIVLKELIRKIELTPLEKRVRPNLLMPKLILILEIHDTGPGTLVMMRLVEKDSRRILETIFHELNNDKTVLNQKKDLTKELVETLKKYQNT